jgi:uncharacterized protein YkwD
LRTLTYSRQRPHAAGTPTHFPTAVNRGVRRTVVALALVFGLSLGAGAQPVFAAGSDTATIVAQTNAARTAKGLPALKRNPAMDAVAQAWAVTMAATGYRHNPEYTLQIPKGWYLAAENIAMGYSSSTVVRAWLDSPGHYANIMGEHTDIGVGYFVADGTTYLVQNFAAYIPVIGNTPTVSGSAKAGHTLTAVTREWWPAPVPLSYQWLRGGVAIPGATARTYVVTNADAAKALKVAVTGKKPGYSSATKTSAATPPIMGALTKTPVPKLSGVVRVGQTVTATAGTWAPAPVALGYQWRKAGVAIPGATGRTYLIRPGDVDAALTVAVTGSRVSFSSVGKVSAGSQVVGVAYATCSKLRAAYTKGVAKAGLSAKVLAQSGSPRVSTPLYTLNRALDADRDGIACEK